MPVFRSTYRLVTCKFCKGRGGPSWHFDEPGEMIIGACHACAGIGWQILYPSERHPTQVPKCMVRFPASISIANHNNHGAAARLEIGQLRPEAFEEQLSARKFWAVRRSLLGTGA